MTTSFAPPPDAPVNEVRLRGRLAAAPVTRTLPSGSVLSAFRLVVPRAPAETGDGEPVVGAAPPRPRPPGVDAIDCVAWTEACRCPVEQAPAGAMIEVWGALRRRFWRGVGGLSSRYEVHVSRVLVSALPAGEPRPAASRPAEA